MKTVRELAKEAGLKCNPFLKILPFDAGTEWQGSDETLERFAALVRAQALEEATKACEGERLEDPCKGEDEAYERAIGHCVTAIRALVP